MEVPLNDTISLRPLSSLTLQDTLNLYLMFPGKDLTTFRDELCALKTDPTQHVIVKTVKRWRNGESRPRKSALTPEELRYIFIGILNNTFFTGNTDMMLSSIVRDLKSSAFNFDTSDIESAAEVDAASALSVVFDILSFTVLDGNSCDQLMLLTDRLHAIAEGSYDNDDSEIDFNLTSAGAFSVSADRTSAAHASSEYFDHNDSLRIGRAVIKFTAPPLPFDVDYYVRYIKNGKDEFLSGKDLMPVNKNIKFKPSGDGPRSMQAVIDNIPLDIGFQFKCFAKCDPKNVPQLCELLAAHIDYSNARFKTDDLKTHYSKRYDAELELIATSVAEPGTVWFMLPDYTAYVTFDPFLNNYFLPEFRDLD